MDRKEKLIYIAVNYRQPMMKAATAILKNYYDAEDAYQDTLIKLFVLVDHIEDVRTSSAKMYCTVILKNTARDLARKKGRHVPCDNVDEMLDVETCSEIYPFDACAAIEEIYTLPEIYRCVVQNRCFQNMSALETADRLKISVSCVNTRLKRARRILAKKLYA